MLIDINPGGGRNDGPDPKSSVGTEAYARDVLVEGDGMNAGAGNFGPTRY